MILLKFATAINGDSVVGGHEKWITCDSLHFGVGRAITTSGGGADRETSNPSFSEVTVTKSTDIASADLYMQAVCGKSLGKAEIHFIQTGGAEKKSRCISSLNSTRQLSVRTPQAAAATGQAKAFQSISSK